MSQRRLSVIWTNPLFQELARLLLQHPDIDWIGAAKNISAAQEEIIRYQPDTVLFEKTEPGFPAEMIEMLEADTWDIRIIGLSLRDNKVCLLQQAHQTMAKASDLLNFILC